MNKNKLTNKVVLILGATGGIGSAVADLLEASGATVCRHGRSGKYAADLKNDEDTNILVTKVLADYKRVDIMVNAVSHPVKINSFDKKTWSDFEDHFQVQLKGGFKVIQKLLPGMKVNKAGRIINILTSYTIGQPPSGLSDYITAKYALLGLTKSLAKELGRYNITVNAVSPSLIKSSFAGDVPEKLFDLVAAQTPLGRLATAEDVAGAVLFLASSEAAYITGQNIVVAGGNVML